MPSHHLSVREDHAGIPCSSHPLRRTRARSARFSAAGEVTYCGCSKFEPRPRVIAQHGAVPGHYCWRAYSDRKCKVFINHTLAQNQFFLNLPVASYSQRILKPFPFLIYGSFLIPFFRAQRHGHLADHQQPFQREGIMTKRTTKSSVNYANILVF